MNRRGAQPDPIVRPAFTFGCNLQPSLSSLHSCFTLHASHAGPRAAAVEDEGVGLYGVLVSAEHTVFLLPDPSYVAYGRHLSAHIQFVMTQVPPTSCSALKQSG